MAATVRGLAMALLAAAAVAGCRAEPVGLQGTISQSIALLEASKDREFFDRFVNPEEKAEILRKVPMEKLLAEFRPGHAEVLLANLKKIQGATPEYSPDLSRATFRVEPEPGKAGPRHLTFVKVGEAWYLSNH